VPGAVIAKRAGSAHALTSRQLCGLRRDAPAAIPQFPVWPRLDVFPLFFTPSAKSAAEEASIEAPMIRVRGARTPHLKNIDLDIRATSLS